MESAERVLIYRLGSLGDTVVALPGFHLIARAFPRAERRLLTNFPVAGKAPPAAAVLQGTGTVHAYFRYTAGTRSFRELLRLWLEIVRWRPQVLVYLGPARGLETAERDLRFFRMCGIRRMVGIPVTDDMQQNRMRLDASLGYEVEEPEAERLARNIAELGNAKLDDAASWNLHLSTQEKARADEALAAAGGRPVMAMSLGTKAQSNDWGEANWCALLGRVAEQYPEYALVLTGAPDDHAASERVAAEWRACAARGRCGPALNVCGELTPRESAALFARAAVYLGHDSGPMHLAAAVGTPCVAVFSAKGRPRRWFPYGDGHRVVYHRVSCWGCGLLTCVVEQKRCILSITPDEVLHELTQVLGPGAASRQGVTTR
jgi:ADP-heptose:LPS heptosyltransferase